MVGYQVGSLLKYFYLQIKFFLLLLKWPKGYKLKLKFNIQFNKILEFSVSIFGFQ